MLHRILLWLESVERARRDAYLAQAADRYDLERRMRDLEQEDFGLRGW